MAYEYVSEKEVKPYRSECSQMLTELRDYLNEEYGIVTQFFLVGSGSDARKLVMRNGNAPFDFESDTKEKQEPCCKGRQVLRWEGFNICYNCIDVYSQYSVTSGF